LSLLKSRPLTCWQALEHSLRSYLTNIARNSGAEPLGRERADGINNCLDGL
jgi:hypothetical protein